MNGRMRCTVIGAGVIGLSCATRLAEAGHQIRLVTDLPPLETTSAVAAALWYPYLAAPRDRVAAWSARTYDALCKIAADHPAAGVRLRLGRELFATRQPDPWWVAAVPDLHRLVAADRPPGFADGWAFTAPVIDMPVYLGWLVARLSAHGGRLELRHVEGLDAELRVADVVVSCPGLGARELVADVTVEPVRGQVVIMTNPGIEQWLLHDADTGRLTYVVPRLSTVVVGGSAQLGSADLQPHPAIAEALLARARDLVPALAGADVISHGVGLRPARPSVRLEVEERTEGRIVHCYGHGGAGVTLSWGCAEEVALLVGR